MAARSSMDDVLPTVLLSGMMKDYSVTGRRPKMNWEDWQCGRYLVVETLWLIALADCSG